MFIYKFVLNMSKTIQLTLPDGVLKVLDKHYRNAIGVKDAEIIRNILIIYLTERGHLPQYLEQWGK